MSIIDRSGAGGPAPIGGRRGPAKGIYDPTFADPSHFARFFRKQTGMIPPAFRDPAAGEGHSGAMSRGVKLRSRLFHSLYLSAGSMA